MDDTNLRQHLPTEDTPSESFSAAGTRLVSGHPITHPDLERSSAVKRVFELALIEEKPNFTQLQLKLMELGASPPVYRKLRETMEARFHLFPLDEKL